MNTKKVSFFRSIHFKLTIIYALLTLVTLQIIGVYFVNELEESLIDNFKESVDSSIQALSYSIEKELSKEGQQDPETLYTNIDNLLQEYIIGADNISEITIVNKDIVVVGSVGDTNSLTIGKKTNQRMITGTGISRQNQEDMMVNQDDKRVIVFTRAIEKNEEELLGVIYVEADIENTYDQIGAINKIFATGTLIALAITAVLGSLVARTIIKPITEMRKQAKQLAKGNFDYRVKVYGDDEIGQLAMTFNQLTAELEDAQETTEEERKKLSSVISHMTDGVIATNHMGEIILLNGPAEKMLSIAHEKVIGTDVTHLLGLEETYTFEELLDLKEPLFLELGTSKEETVIKVLTTIIQKEEGHPHGLIAVLYDVTEQEKVEEERREFVANVSHELRTPLTTMRSYLEVLSEGGWRDEKIAPQFLQVTQGETERMIRLVNDLLKLSKLDSRDYQLNKDYINFTDFINKIIDRFEMSKKTDIIFRRMIPKEIVYVDIDTDKITQVIDNIISNAMKYSPEGGQVTFKMNVDAESIVVSIRDQGVGIPKENLDKIFERFYRVDKARSRKLGGTGLGLAIAKEMIQAHGGDIWAESEEGIGTTIHFSLPKEEQEDDWS
ncbi:cell wall metabolism sensor histidine kinase WalK [Bacillus carboniphilus]|uniref:histidine kinase n=1 Tax=Bacillus carboniphilus TaxID=86663 RepID=A0ABY9JR43_9BACI|nr:cell wall metabolism sensor histidine kinase WalK [Bacillus carboniphilus]WLR41861.1 cell wall metabolism sensor histidine kinase WalK [Bacillus carboniphilus]